MARPEDPKLSEVLADWLFNALVGAGNATLPEADLSGAKFTIPWGDNSPVFAAITKPTIEELLAQFNSLMGGIETHILKEYNSNRITGAKYADVYLAMMQSAMQSAVQFCLGKDQAFWMAAKTQADAITAATANETAKIDAMYRRANYALTKLKLATEDSQFGQSEYQRTEILIAQRRLLAEQTNAQAAQTSNLRDSDGNAVMGLIKVQKDLYTQQIQSYKDDTRLKATRFFSDLWTTQKTINEDLSPSAYFQPTKLDVSGSEKALDPIFKQLRLTAMGDGATQQEKEWDPANP